MWSILAAILNVGNVVYSDAGNGKPANITNPNVVQIVAGLLQVSVSPFNTPFFLFLFFFHSYPSRSIRHNSLMC
jgi:hypothetical protein